MSIRCARFAGRIKNTVESCLVSALESRRAPSLSKNEIGSTRVDLLTTFTHIMEIFFSIENKTLIIAQLINILETSCYILYCLSEST